MSTLDAMTERVRSAPRPLTWNPWLAVAQQCASEAGPTDQGLAWARLAVRLYDWLAEDTTEPNSFAQSGMLLRARAIRDTKAVAGDDLRDPERIFAWVRASMFASLDETIARADQLRAQISQAPPADLMAIRAIKNRLNVLVALPADAVPADLRAWQAVRDQLI